MRHASTPMGIIAQPLPCRLGVPNAAAQVCLSRCSKHSSSIASLQQTSNARHTLVGLRQVPQTSRPISGGVLLQPVRRHHRGRAASADEQPAPSEEERGASAPSDTQLQQQVANFGEAVAQSEREAFLAARDQLRQQQAEQPRQQAAESQQLQGVAAAVPAQDGRANIATGAAAPAAAASIGGASPASTSAAAPAESPSAASGSQQPEASAPQAASGGAGKLDMAAAVREKLAQAAEYRKVASCKYSNVFAHSMIRSMQQLTHGHALAPCMTPWCLL